MAKHPLFDGTRGWDLTSLPSPYKENPYLTRTNDPAHFSEFHPSGRATTNIHGYVLAALLAYINGAQSEIAMVKVGEGTYATERELASGETELFVLYANGQCKGAVRTPGGRHMPFGTIGGRNDDFDGSALMLAVLMRICDISVETKAKVADAVAQGVVPYGAACYISDAVRFGLEEGHIKAIMPGGNIDLLTAQTIKSGALAGTVLCGKPKFLVHASGVGATGVLTFQEAMQEFEEWRKRNTWTEAEQALIPSFPADYPVLPEAMKICRRYVGTHEDKRPMLNMMWRGVTSYGKSTGVEQIAAMLNMPLLRLTCSSTMETQDFLSNIVPVSKPAVCDQLPTFDEMAFDPESAYAAITGKTKEGVTSEECLTAYAEAFAAKENPASGPLFRQVNSNFVRALERGYLLEIQEASRIKDPGVLVALNEYDRPGAIIPLVDGSYVRRHADAMVIWTDNVGYASCRNIDPSVLRRMALILDSNTIPKETALSRVVYNTGFQDQELLQKMYAVWEEIQVFCADRDITDGTISLTELERWAQCVMADGYANVKDNCIECVVAKATSVKEEQDDMISSVLAVHLSE